MKKIWNNINESEGKWLMKGEGLSEVEEYSKWPLVWSENDEDNDEKKMTNWYWRRRNEKPLMKENCYYWREGHANVKKYYCVAND